MLPFISADAGQREIGSASVREAFLAPAHTGAARSLRGVAYLKMFQTVELL